MESLKIINCNIITLDENNPSASSLYIENGRIKEIDGTSKSTQIIDLNGATIIPGFIDAHFHLKNFGKRLNQINLKKIASLELIRKKVKEEIKKINSNEWILGFGWDQNLWENKNFPLADLLNEVSPNNPIYFTRIDGHAAWVNKCAIEKTRLNISELNQINGGKVINDCIVIDNSMRPFQKYLPKENKSQVKKWISLAANKAAKMGITGVHDAWQDKLIVDSIKELIDKNELPIRCYGMLAGNDRELLNIFFNEGYFNHDYYSIRSVKAFIDGALGSRGAALHDPYSDDHNNCGLILISKEDFANLAKLCHKYKFQLNTHAIGDRGNDYVLNHYSDIVGKNNDRRWRIEHAQMVTDSDIDRFKEFNILPSMQPSHCTSDMKWLPERIGNHRLQLISRWQTFIEAGLKIPGGSDCPIEDGNPLFEFYAAVTRQDHNGFPQNGFQPQEKVNKLNALKMFTSWAAFGGFDEKRRGKIKPGYDADLTILDKNILEIDSSQILATKVLFTIVNGKIIYENI